MKIKNRRSVNNELIGYCSFAKPSDFVEVTEWSNGDGVDVSINAEHNLGSRTISMTWGEFEAMKKAIKFLTLSPKI